LQQAAVAAGVLLAQPLTSTAAEKIPRPKISLKEQLYGILRVQESTTQEARLIKTGKYRDLQRLNVKRAIRMMIDNSDLATRFALATAFAPLDQVTAATDYGNTAVEALTQIIEYFPQDLQANDLGPEQKKFVSNALATASKSIDSFLMLMPKDTVDAARAQLEEENALNMKEFPKDELELLNPPEVGV